MIIRTRTFLVFAYDTFLDSSRYHRQRGGLRKSAARRGGATASNLSMLPWTEVHQPIHFNCCDFFGYFLIKESDKRLKKMNIDG